MSEQATQPTAVQPENTPTVAVNNTPTVDIESIIKQAADKATEAANAAAEKKMGGVFKSMLEQNGLDADAINKITAEWKSQQQTPEQTLADKDTAIATLQKQLEAEQEFRITDLKYSAVESDFLAMGADPDTLELLMLKVDLKAVELDGKKVKNKDALEPYKEQFPKLFKPKEEPKPDPEFVSAPMRNDPVPDKEKRKQNYTNKNFF